MKKAVVASLVALCLSACVSTRDQLVSDLPDAPKHRKVIAAEFQRTFGHNWILGDLHLRSPGISGPFASAGITGATVYQYCINAYYEQGPFRKQLYGKAVVVQAGSALDVRLRQTPGLECQTQPKPFTELAEIVAQKTGTTVETVQKFTPPSW